MHSTSVIMFGVAALAAASLAFAALPPVAQVGARPIRIEPATRSQDLAALPDAQIVEFPHGLRASMGQIRSLGAAVLKARARRAGPDVMRTAPPGPTIDVGPGLTLQQIERAPDNALLQLPDGRRISVAQLKAVRAAQTKARSVAAGPARAPVSGPVVKVPKGAKLDELLKRPDSDVLESPNGKRVTVGELRRVMQGVAPASRRTP